MSQTAMRNGPTRGKFPGVAAIDVNGDRYCLDCAKDVLDCREVTYQLDNGDCDDSASQNRRYHDSQNRDWKTVENVRGERIVRKLINGDIYTLSSGGVVLRNSVHDGSTWHCGRHSECLNAIDGEDHGYDHNEPIGVKLDV